MTGDHRAMPVTDTSVVRVAPVPVSLGRQLGIAVFDVAVPIGCYYLLRAAGFSALPALAVSAVPPVLAAGWELARKRRVDVVAVAVIATMALSVLLAAAVHDPRFLLAREGLLTGLWGLVFMASLAFRRPVAFTIARPLLEGRRAFAAVSWDSLWCEEPIFRRVWRVSSLVWGGALLTDAVLRILMSILFPVDQVPLLGGLLWPATLVVINVVTNIYYRKVGLFRLLGARRLVQR